MAKEEVISVIIWKVSDPPICIFSSNPNNLSTKTVITGQTLTSYIGDDIDLLDKYNDLLDNKTEQIIMTENIQTMMFYLRDGLFCELKINTDDKLLSHMNQEDNEESDNNLRNKIKFETDRWLNNIM
jgi:hypothetical protein